MYLTCLPCVGLKLAKSELCL